jgi:hypothetical protein
MIDKIQAMRKLTKKSRFQADSLPEIRGGLDLLAFELKEERVGSRPVSEGHVVNAAVLILLAMPEDQRRRLAIEAFQKMNVLLSLDMPTSEQIHSIVYGAHAKNPVEEHGVQRMATGVTVKDTTDEFLPENPPDPGPKRQPRKAKGSAS